MCYMCLFKIPTSEPESPHKNVISYLAGILCIPLVDAKVSLLGQRLGRKVFSTLKTSMKEAGWELAGQVWHITGLKAWPTD